jgi:hypothetical protein
MGFIFDGFLLFNALSEIHNKILKAVSGFQKILFLSNLGCLFVSRLMNGYSRIFYVALLKSTNSVYSDLLLTGKV